MNKRELVKEIQNETGLSQELIDKVVKTFTTVVTRQMVRQGDVSLVGFGTFSVANRKERKQINPQTKQFITVPAKKVPVFKFSEAVKKQVSSVDKESGF